MSKTEILENLNVEITCRSCLVESDQLTSLFAVANNNDLSFGDILANISHNKINVKLYNKIDLPTKICDLCQQDLLLAYNFKIKTEKSENILREYLKNINANIEEITVPVETDYGFINIKSEQNFENELVTEKSEEEDDIDAGGEYVDYENNSFEKFNNDENDECDEDQAEEKIPLAPRIGQGKFHCHLCKSKFSTQGQLNNHMKIHENGVGHKFYCTTCDKCFATNRNLHRHMKLHLKEQLTNQMKIDKFFTPQRDPMETDIQYDVPEIDPNQEEENKDDIKLDLRIFKPETKLKPGIDRNYPCQFCSSRFSNQIQLDCHMKAHSAKKFFCEACDRYFVNNRNLQRHLKLHYGPSEFKCSHCTKTFESKLRWKLHERSHLVKESDISGYDFDKNSCMPNEIKTLECKICNVVFTKIFLLREHLQTHTNLETIDIENIRKNNYLINLVPDGGSDLSKVIDYIVNELQEGRTEKFYSATNMVGNELRLSDSETDTDSEDSKNLLPVNLYVCQICEQTFTRRYKILYHQRNDHSAEELGNECGICEMKYASKNLLDYHIKTQCGNIEKHFTCDVCKIKYMWKENIEQHIQIHHIKSKQPIKLIGKYTTDKKLECDICQKKFSRPEHLSRHQRTHNPDEKKFECEKCQKKFSRKDNLKSHMKVHDENHNDPSEESKSFLCVFCGRKFRNSSNLVVHTRRHTGEKPFKCDFCDKGFPRSSDLRTHRRTHTGEKPHLCTLCGKGFSRSNKLTRHMRIHSGIRPYKCTYCDRAFTQSNDLTIHVRRHTGEKPYVCGICGERFIQGTALQNHRKSRGHFEEGNVNVPFSYISQNNPNPLNNSGRVDRIGMPKNNATGNNSVVEPQPLQRFMGLSAPTATSTSGTYIISGQEEIIGLNFKNIASFVNAQQSMHEEESNTYEIPSSSFKHDSN